MQDWSQYIGRSYQEVLEELKAEGYQVVDDGLFAGYTNTEMQKDDIKIQLACAPVDMDDFDEKLNEKERTYELDDVDWYTFEIYDEAGNLLTDD